MAPANAGFPELLSWEDCEKALNNPATMPVLSDAVASQQQLQQSRNHQQLSQQYPLHLDNGAAHGQSHLFHDEMSFGTSQRPQEFTSIDHKSRSTYPVHDLFDSSTTIAPTGIYSHAGNDHNNNTIGMPHDDFFDARTSRHLPFQKTPVQNVNNRSSYNLQQQPNPSNISHQLYNGDTSSVDGRGVDPISNDQHLPVQSNNSKDAYGVAGQVALVPNEPDLVETNPKLKRKSSRKAKPKAKSTSSSSEGEDLAKASGAAANGAEEDEDIIRKRKAQNRAAQRAFRERKEARVRELEQKLNESEKEKKRLFFENERLKRENTVVTTENQVLLATGHVMPYDQQQQSEVILATANNEIELMDADNEDGSHHGFRNSSATPPIKSEHGDISFSQNSINDNVNGQNDNGAREGSNQPFNFISKERNPSLVSQRIFGTVRQNTYHKPLRAVFPVHKFNFELLREHDAKLNEKTNGTRDLTSDNACMKEPLFIAYHKQQTEETMLGAGAVWELIATQPEVEDIDVAGVMNYLKGKECCDGFGPVFKKSDVLKGIEIVKSKGQAMDIDD